MKATRAEVGDNADNTQDAAEVKDRVKSSTISKRHETITDSDIDHETAEPQTDSIAEPEEIGIDQDKIKDAEVLEQQLQKSNTAASERPYSSFTLCEKRTIVCVASLAGFISPLTTNIYFRALNTIAADLGVSFSALNLTVTTYMIFQGLAPSFIGSFADT